ncbi:MAG TPA: aromatic amino acid ammonia-lyase [Gaiellales bacterium]|nr:aromatic amino acid ammonia-lyase [Gaiellales bacterium]
MSAPLVLTGFGLTAADVAEVARGGRRVELPPEAHERMGQGWEVVREAVRANVPVYGLTTGVGAHKRISMDADQLEHFNLLLLPSHRVGQGPFAPADVVRAALLRLVNGFASGTTGVRPELAARLVEALNAGETPGVRMLGSVGQADLAPMADLAHGVIGDFQLTGTETLSLVNSNAFSTAIATLALADCHLLLDSLDVAGAFDMEAFAANLSVLHPEVARVRPYAGLAASLERLRGLLAGSYLWDAGAARNLQDPLTFRNLAHVHGAARDALGHADAMLAIELNASQQNPLLVLEERRFISVANYDVLPLAAALDLVRISLAPVLTSACERTLKLLASQFSGLPLGLSADPESPEDALSEFGVAAAALAAEARLLAQPVSFELATTSIAEGIEDRMTMAPLGARRLDEMVGLGERIAAIELVVAAQAVDLRKPRALGGATGELHRLVRKTVSFTGPGHEPPQDLVPVLTLLRSGAVASCGAGPADMPTADR